ncbi:hypothetical protein M422DRAFT_265536 [Sphaerobolus stellatus SS14]|uniref:Uncharacterized protein n=1 Tax=Sphaerobolus stellatus (strain SS14) TaxID=990650 RepID=A0A0C9V575_SPHS4|nr:hypothetical protein M422DRAFT_265536 [Sphaerobolus stellatus SS14]
MQPPQTRPAQILDRGLESAKAIGKNNQSKIDLPSKIDSEEYQELNARLEEGHVDGDGEYLEDDSLDNEDIEEIDEGPRKMYSEAWRMDMKRRFDAMLAETDTPIGLHPKAVRSLDPTFDDIYKAGGHYLSYRGRRKRQRTWKDHNELTMYLD